jgi:hypothetical protein
MKQKNEKKGCVWIVGSQNQEEMFRRFQSVYSEAKLLTLGEFVDRVTKTEWHKNGTGIGNITATNHMYEVTHVDAGCRMQLSKAEST